MQFTLKEACTAAETAGCRKSPSSLQVMFGLVSKALDFVGGLAGSMTLGSSASQMPLKNRGASGQLMHALLLGQVQIRIKDTKIPWGLFA